MATNYVDKDEITAEIINIQLREKIRQVNKSIEEVGAILKKTPEHEPNWELREKYEKLLAEQKALIEKGADPEYSRQKFGEIVLLINENLLKKPCFRNYSENWTEDFKSNAIYKIFKYINNFDPEKISKVTGRKISSFAYLTQITYMAFVEVINKRKKDNSDLMDNMIPLQDLKPEHFGYSKFERSSSYYPNEEDERTYFIIDNVKTSLYDQLKIIRETNDAVHVTYPANYSLSIDEFTLIDSLKFDKLTLIKQKEAEECFNSSDDEDTCFAFADEEFEDWGEWSEKDAND
jgi:hypothetical protein